MISKNAWKIGCVMSRSKNARLRQHAQHLRLEVAPVLVAEVVDDDEAALLQVRAQARRLLVGHDPGAGLAHVRDRVLEQLRIVERQDVRFVRVRVQVAQLVQDLHEMLLAGRVVVRPRQPLRGEAVVGAVAQPHEREPAVVRRVRLNRLAPVAAAEAAAAEAAPLRERARHAAIAAAPAGPAACVLTACPSCACRSRSALVFSARSVSSFSICASYCAASIDGLHQPQRGDLAARSRRAPRRAPSPPGSVMSTFSAASARPVPRNTVAASWPSPPSSSVACSVRSSPSAGRPPHLRLRVLERFAHRDVAVAIAIRRIVAVGRDEVLGKVASRSVRRRSWSR